VISGIRGVAGGERPEVFELMCSLRATESESTKKRGTEIRRVRWCRKEGVSLSRDEIQKVYSTQSGISELERESRHQGSSSWILLESRIVGPHFGALEAGSGICSLCSHPKAGRIRLLSSQWGFGNWIRTKRNSGRDGVDT
jgi:hypothetical protein